MNTQSIAPCAALWYDGRSSQPKPVHVVLQPGQGGPTLVLHDAPSADSEGSVKPLAVYLHDKVGWPEHYNPRRPPARLVADLGESGSLEITDPVAWHAAVQAAGMRTSLARRMQTRWPVFLGVLVAAVIVISLFQRYGAPWLATQIVRLVPHEWELSLADMTLQSLADKETLKPSRLPQARQDALRERFNALTASIPPDLQRYHGYAPQYSLTFHRGTGLLAFNAFALPGGAVVMTDGIVRIAERAGLSDDALVGVLAHELGHIVHRHSMRRLAETGALGLTLSLATGDLSGVWAAASTVVSGFAYTRAHEREADCFALALMQRLHIPTEPMGELFLTFAGQSQTRHAAQGKDDAASPTSTQSSPSSRSGSHLFRTHPDTLARAAQFRQPDLAGYCE